MYRIIGLLGLVFGVAPFIFQYTDNTPALCTSIGLGAIAIVASLVEAADQDKGRWEYWAVGIVGLAAIAAPFLFSFGSITAALWTSVSVGILLTLMAGSKLVYGSPNS